MTEVGKESQFSGSRRVEMVTHEQKTYGPTGDARTTESLVQHWDVPWPVDSTIKWSRKKSLIQERKDTQKGVYALSSVVCVLEGRVVVGAKRVRGFSLL